MAANTVAEQVAKAFLPMQGKKVTVRTEYFDGEIQRTETYDGVFRGVLKTGNIYFFKIATHTREKIALIKVSMIYTMVEQGFPTDY